MNLIEEVAEAREYLSKAMNHLDQLYIFPGERFKEILPAVLGSTSPDLQGEVISLEVLNSTVDSLSHEPFWITVNHDPAIHPVGRVLTAKVFQSTERDIWFIAALIGQYNPITLPTLRDFLKREMPLSPRPDESIEEAHLSFNRFEISPDTIRELIAEAPKAISSCVYEEPRKSGVIVITIFTLIVPGAWFAGFSKSFGTKVGEAVGEKLVQVTGWLGHKVVSTLRRQISDPVLLLETEVSGCRVQFIINCSSEAKQIEAAECIPAQVDASMHTLAQLLQQQPVRLVFEYDTCRKKWIPSYAVTRTAGVITDKPYLAAIHARGLSLAGRTTAPLPLLQESGAQNTSWHRR